MAGNELSNSDEQNLKKKDDGRLSEKLLASRFKEINPSVKKILFQSYNPSTLKKKFDSLSPFEKQFINQIKVEHDILTDDDLIEYLIERFYHYSLPSDRTSLSIPLMEKIDGLHTISYYEDIKNFKKNCYSTRTPLYDLILNSLETLWVNRYQKTEAYQVFSVSKDFENILFKDPRYRDHFLHQFQVFLSGLPIIDTHYEKIKNTYVNKFSESSAIEIEFSWMLAATFHDNGYLVQKFDRWLKGFFIEFLKIEDLPVKIDLYNLLLTRNFQDYIDKLTSLYLSLNDGQPTQWDYDGLHKIDHEFRKELTSSLVHDRNHGIISALILLDRIENSKVFKKTSGYKQKFFQSVVFPAGLAICLHDKDILSSEKIKPINFNKDPLSFILIYCDTIQEWGRPNSPSVNNYCDLSPRLSNYKITDELVSATITYDKIENFKIKGGEKTNFEFKDEEIKSVLKKLRSPDIIFEIILQSTDKDHEFGDSSHKSLR